MVHNQAPLLFWRLPEPISASSARAGVQQPPLLLAIPAIEPEAHAAHRKKNRATVNKAGRGVFTAVFDGQKKFSLENRQSNGGTIR
jgi:hypothetical protein